MPWPDHFAKGLLSFLFICLPDDCFAGCLGRIILPKVCFHFFSFVSHLVGVCLVYQVPIAHDLDWNFSHLQAHSCARLCLKNGYCKFALRLALRLRSVLRSFASIAVNASVFAIFAQQHRCLEQMNEEKEKEEKYNGKLDLMSSQAAGLGKPESHVEI